MFDSLIAAGNSFQIVGADKLKERLPKLDSDWLSVVLSFLSLLVLVVIRFSKY